MTVEPIGLAILALGLLCLPFGQHVTVAVFIMTTLFGSAAALLIGSANIQPGHVFLCFAALACLSRRREAALALHALRPFKPGFWLACLVAYGVISAFFMPRIFAGAAQIVPLGGSAFDDTGFTVPLGPVSSNLTQSVYLTANLLCFALTAAVASSAAGFRAVLAGLLGYAAGNAAFALADLGAYATGTQDLLEFMRNARYTLHTEAEISGMKRIVGSFTEASSFARSTLGVLGFAGTLWLCGCKPALTGPLAAASLALLVLSTSSTGLVGAPLMLLVLYATAFMRAGTRAEARYSSAVILAAPPLLILAALLVVFNAELMATVRDYVDLVVLNKANSDSGIERSSWNAAAYQNFIDTWGLGVGLGTARASSLLLALLSNVGVIGAAFFALFVATALLRRESTPRSFFANGRMAARNACLGLILGDLLVSPVIDMGLLFSVLAGLAAASPERFEPSRTAAIPSGARA